MSCCAPTTPRPICARRPPNRRGISCAPKSRLQRYRLTSDGRAQIALTTVDAK